MNKTIVQHTILLLTILLASTASVHSASGQMLDKIRLGYGGTGTTSYVTEMGRRLAYSAKMASTWKLSR
jgi:hypothetical protein